MWDSVVDIPGRIIRFAREVHTEGQHFSAGREVRSKTVDWKMFWLNITVCGYSYCSATRRSRRGSKTRGSGELARKRQRVSMQFLSLFSIGPWRVPTWTSPLFLVAVTALIPNTSFLGHSCALAIGYACMFLSPGAVVFLWQPYSPIPLVSAHSFYLPPQSWSRLPPNTRATGAHPTMGGREA